MMETSVAAYRIPTYSRSGNLSMVICCMPSSSREEDGIKSVLAYRLTKTVSSPLMSGYFRTPNMIVALFLFIFLASVMGALYVWTSNFGISSCLTLIRMSLVFWIENLVFQWRSGEPFMQTREKNN
jgi:hypothetical protein